MSSGIEVKQLSVQFDQFRALDHLTFSIPQGAFLAIVGPNGSGKSVLIQALIGLIPPTEGTITVLGEIPVRLPADSIGYVPQIKSLDRTFPAQAVELVLTGLYHHWPWRIPEADREKAIQALQKVGAEHLSNRPIGKLSGGELQRVYLARCLIRRPRLIVLDEPATGIDVTLATDMYHILEEAQAQYQTTIVMATHDLAVAAHHASHVLLLNRRLIGFGSPDEVLTEQCLRETFGHLGHEHTLTLEERRGV